MSLPAPADDVGTGCCADDVVSGGAVIVQVPVAPARAAFGLGSGVAERHRAVLDRPGAIDAHDDSARRRRTRRQVADRARDRSTRRRAPTRRAQEGHPGRERVDDLDVLGPVGSAVGDREGEGELVAHPRPRRARALLEPEVRAELEGADVAARALGAGEPRWSVPGRGQPPAGTAFIAGLPIRSACVSVGPPLSASGPSRGSARSSRPQLAPGNSRFLPSEVIGPAQLSPSCGFATSVSSTVSGPIAWAPISWGGGTRSALARLAPVGPRLWATVAWSVSRLPPKVAEAPAAHVGGVAADRAVLDVRGAVVEDPPAEDVGAVTAYRGALDRQVEVVANAAAISARLVLADRDVAQMEGAHVANARAGGVPAVGDRQVGDLYFGVRGQHLGRIGRGHDRRNVDDAAPEGGPGEHARRSGARSAHDRVLQDVEVADGRIRRKQVELEPRSR